MKNIKISIKLLVLVLILSIIIVFVGVMGIRSLQIVNSEMKTLYNDRIVPLEELKNISDAYAVSIVDVAHKARNGNISWKKALRELDKAEKRIELNWQSYQQTKIQGEELRLLKEANKLKENAELAFSDLIEILSNDKNTQNQALLDSFVLNELYLTIDPFTEKISELSVIQLEISKQINQNSEIIYNDSKTKAYLLISFAILVGFLISYFIIMGINKSIAQLNDALFKVSNGDLMIDLQIESKDEIGQLTLNLKNMVEKLRHIVSVIISGADNIVKASNESSYTSQQISQGANEQASSAEEVSSSIEQMVANIQQNTDNARETERIALQTSENITEAGNANNQAVNSMTEIAKKITIISEIANQTNILSINAAVEAARAGQYGKGFAVVADEIRKLADRSRTAAADIEELSKKGMAISEKSGKVMNQIIPEVIKTSHLVQEIAASSIEQNSGADQINNAIQQLNQVIQQNAAASEELAASSEELSSQAIQLKETVNYFKVTHRNFNFAEPVAKNKNTFKNQNPIDKGINLKMNDKTDYDAFESF